MRTIDSSFPLYTTNGQAQLSSLGHHSYITNNNSIHTKYGGKGVVVAGLEELTVFRGPLICSGISFFLKRDCGFIGEATCAPDFRNLGLLGLVFGSLACGLSLMGYSPNRRA